MSGVLALAAAGLWMIASAALAPAQADDAPQHPSPMAGQGQPSPMAGQSQAAPAAGQGEAAPTAGQGQAAGDSQQAAINGNQLFATTCGFCHEDGGRRAGRGPKLAGTTRSDEFIIHRITYGKPGAMPAWGKVYSQEQIKQILAYIRSLKP
jgi:mono/diheme cytochrome c family protein